MIRVHNLSVHYGLVPALKHVNLEIPQGQCVLIAGPSGCGKSTLARVLTGLIPHVVPARIDGEVSVASLEVPANSVAELARHVGAVFQNPSTQLFHLRVDDEVAFGVRNLDLPEDQVQRRVAWALAAVGLEGFEDRRPAELSGGQKQRLVIATALAMKPQVLVLDEPTASLDVPGTQQVMATLKALRERLGLTIVLIEQRLAEAARLADRVVIIAEGTIVANSRPEQVLSNRHLLHRLGLRRPTDEPSEDWRKLLAPNGRPPHDTQPLLELHEVSAGYNGKTAITGVDLSLYPGEFVALVGDNGAGKSTLGMVAAGLLKPTHGRVEYEGGKRPRGGLDVAMLFQNPLDQLITDLVDEEVAFGPQNYSKFEVGFHRQTLEATDLLSLRARRPSSLSAGQQQRTALASCLALQPKLLILDEPTLGQDWGHMQRLMDFVVRLNQMGTTIVLITHDYKLVHRYAIRTILMEAGRITLDGRLRRREKRNTP
jgi:energy-coupling factor transporter ATP-binding protein EcfA2